MKVVVTATYERDAKRLLKMDEQAAMEQAIVDAPDAHPVIPWNEWSPQRRVGRGRAVARAVACV